MDNHQLLVLLNIIRSTILIAALFGAVAYKRVDRRLTIVVCSVLLTLNFAGLGIALFLVHNAS